MVALLIGVGALGGLIWIGIQNATGPSKSVARDRDIFERLKLRKVLNLDEAEDGLVLARRFGEKAWVKRFAGEVIRLRKKRVPV